MQQGDIKHTHANVKKLIKLIRFKPNTKVEKGIKNFVNWFNESYD